MDYDGDSDEEEDQPTSKESANEQSGESSEDLSLSPKPSANGNIKADDVTIAKMDQDAPEAAVAVSETTTPSEDATEPSAKRPRVE